MKFLRRLSIIGITLILSLNVKANLKSIIAEYNKGNLNSAHQLAHHHNLKGVHDFLLTQKYLNKNDTSSFEEITHFLMNHPNWPQFKALRSVAESRINHSTSKTKIVRWFDQHKPQNASSYAHYYNAAILRVKNDQKLNSIIKATWASGAFSKKQADQFLVKHKKILTMEDHVDRISELLWLKKTDEVKNYLPLVDKNYQQVFAAWIVMIKNDPKAEQAFRKIKGSYRYHSGLIYSYLKLHMKDVPNQELINLHIKAQIDSKHAKEWWKIKNYFARELLETKNYNSAYRIVSNHNLRDPADSIEAEWFSGWLALRYVKKPAESIKHFEHIYAASKSSISKSRGAYWLGRAYKAMNKPELAGKWFKIAAKLGFTFYGQLAQYEMGYKNLILPLRAVASKEDMKKHKINSLAQIAEFLAQTNHHELLKLYTKEAFYNASSEGEIAIIYERVSPYLNLNTNVEIAKLAQHAGVLIPESSYPSPYKAVKSYRDPALAFSIIRQESVFDQFAVSEDNAQGLMQVMPQTVKTLASKLGLKYDFKKLTQDPNYNIKFGLYYLDNVMKEYDNSYVMMCSNYNAGPVANKWQERFGKRDGIKLYQAIDWIESIPFYETRNYVQRVLENIQVYRYMLTGNKRLKIKEDIIK